MKLSEHFTLDEFIVTIHRNIDNTPPKEITEQLSYTARCLEAVRELLGAPITINSGYRCPALNLLVGSRSTSQHLLGQAVDFTAKSFGTSDEIVKKIMESNIEFDQLIREYDSWVHISFNDKPRKQVLIIDKKGVRKYGT